jgi:hypothetical protein
MSTLANMMKCMYVGMGELLLQSRSETPKKSKKKATSRKIVNSDFISTTNSDHGDNETSCHYRESNDNKTTA